MIFSPTAAADPQYLKLGQAADIISKFHRIPVDLTNKEAEETS
jgi:hypothetical protein